MDYCAKGQAILESDNLIALILREGKRNEKRKGQKGKKEDNKQKEKDSLSHPA